MFDPLTVPVLPMAKSMPEPYNYLTNSVFSDVHYYNGNSNGNSFRFWPFQHIQGSHHASIRRLKRYCAWSGTLELGSGVQRREPNRPRRGNRDLNSPKESVNLQGLWQSRKSS
jgi:hypothetical protein